MDNYKTTAKILIAVNIMLITAVAIFLVGYSLKKSKETESSPAPTAQVTAQPTPSVTQQPTPIPTSQAKKATIRQFLKNAAKPIGSTMYVYGGGWNKEDTGAGEYARTLGVPQEWKDFAVLQDSTYDSSKHKYEITKGLDCSGYVGWVLYNTLETENGKPGYVFLAQSYADILSAMNLGEKTAKQDVGSYKPGDILSSAEDEHVWIAIGECSDHSVLLFNCTPPGVSLYGTATPDGEKNSMAVRLAKKYMREHFPQWYGKYTNYARGTSYLTNYNRFRWDMKSSGVMSDPDGYYNLTPEQILDDIFN